MRSRIVWLHELEEWSSVPEHREGIQGMSAMANETLRIINTWTAGVVELSHGMAHADML